MVHVLILYNLAVSNARTQAVGTRSEVFVFYNFQKFYVREVTTFIVRAIITITFSNRAIFKVELLYFSPQKKNASFCSLYLIFWCLLKMLSRYY